MPSARGIAWLGALVFAVACGTIPPGDPLLPLMPTEVRRGMVESAIAPVEPDVAPEEIASTVAAMIEAAPLCFTWPSLWLRAEDSRSIYVVRFDLMARDWGENVAAESERRMMEFVEMGFLTRTERPDLGPGAAEFTLTPSGRAHLRGSPYGGSHPRFCPPTGRSLQAITNIEWGQFNCGSVHVRFTHVADHWPAWAQSQIAQTHLTNAFGALGSELEGSVSLSRLWYRREDVPPGFRNGSLQSVCYDAALEEIVGDDLTLVASGS